MAINTAVKGIRDYIATKVASAWSGTRYTHEEPEMVETPPFAFIRIENISFDPDSVASSDDALVSYTVVGRWANTGADSGNKIDKADALRDALLADKTAGGYGWLPMVTEYIFDSLSPMDKDYEVGVRYQIHVTADR